MAEKAKKGKTGGKEPPKKKVKETGEPAAEEAKAGKSEEKGAGKAEKAWEEKEGKAGARGAKAEKVEGKIPEKKEKIVLGEEKGEKAGAAEKERKKEEVHGESRAEHRGKPAQKGKKPGKRPEKQAWVDYSPADIEKLVASLAASGHNSAEIGTMLAEQYAVPSVKAITGKRIEKIMAERKALGEMPRDLLDLIKKSVKLLNHMKQNKKDMSAKRGYGLTVSKIRKVAAYYAKNGKIRAGWRYTPEEAVLLVK